MSNSLENEVKREARWTLMLGLEHAKDVGLHEGMIGVIFADMHYSLSPSDVRSALYYLQELGFCKVDKNFQDKLWAVITAKGIDLVEYNTPCPESIARPDKKWF